MGTWMDGRPLRRAPLPLACLLAAAAAIALAAGCGGAGGGSSSTSASAPVRKVVHVERTGRDRWAYARERFREQCAGCHTLADAGATGKRFNLDRDGHIDKDRARFAIEHGEPGMPAWKDTLTRREFDELVDYVSSVAKGGGGENYWAWQAHLRMAGEQWRPEQGPYAPDGTEGIRAGNGMEAEARAEAAAAARGR
jgi:mono/diheme cytochrome c family protein